MNSITPIAVCLLMAANSAFAEGEQVTQAKPVYDPACQQMLDIIVANKAAYEAAEDPENNATAQMSKRTVELTQQAYDEICNPPSSLEAETELLMN